MESSINQYVNVFLVLSDLVKLGIAVTVFGYLGLKPVKRFLSSFRWYTEHRNQRFLDQIKRTLVAENDSPKIHRPILAYLGVAMLVIGSAVALQVLGIMLSTGYAILSYQALGTAPDLIGMYRIIVAFTVLLTISVMTHAKDRVLQPTNR